MLVYQWGTYDWAAGPSFEFNVTRQFILAGSDGDDGISQLSLTLHFTPTNSLNTLGAGDRWCNLPSELDAFVAVIRKSKAYRAVVDLTPDHVSLAWGSL